jgi:tRNA (cmo5U34)-methyltransferase
MARAAGGFEMSTTDRIFSEQGAYPGGFQFDENVVRVFPDMISRSAPGYELIIPMIGMMARRYAIAGSNIYDLGCSLGAASLSMRRAICKPGVSIVAVDNSRAMANHCRDQVAKDHSDIPVTVIEGDIRKVNITNASVVVLNFTLQFLPTAERQGLLNRLSAGMVRGGLLILSEKICFEDTGEQEQQTAWHHDFKRAQGYSDLEISAKRSALENVLVPDTEAEHFKRLTEAGFSSVTRWFQCFSFASYAAIH